MDWRMLRRRLGFWLVGELPRAVHCQHCGHILTAWCIGCRDRVKTGPKP